MSFYKDHKELIDQPLHSLMGAAIALPVALGLSMVIPWWAAFIVGALLSRAIWMARESSQKNYQYIVWWNLDLLFIDLGIVIGLVAAGLFGGLYD